MSTPGQLGLNLNNSLVANMLNEPDKMQDIYDYTGGYNVFSLILDKISPAREIDGQYGQFQKPIMGLSQVGAFIATSTQVNTTTVTLTWTDATYNFFRVTDNVQNSPSSNVRALVIAAAPGTITIQSTDGVTALPASGWAAGAWISSQWNTQPYVSTGLRPYYEVPAYVTNGTEKTRDTTVIYRDDLYKTWPRIAQGSKYFAFAQEKLLLNRVTRALEQRAVWGQYSFNAANQSGTNQGLFYAITNPISGGVVYPFTSVPTQQDFEDFITSIAERYNGEKVTLTALVGRGFLSIVQQFTTPFVQASGINNTFGGSLVEGIDTYKWASAGVSITFTILPALGNSTLFNTPTGITGLNGTQASYFCFVVDTTPFATIDGGSQVPAMERVYFGPNEFLYKVAPGVIDGGVADNSPLFSSVPTDIAVNDVDGITFQIYTNSGVSIMGYRCGMMYPAF
jgi:hypothetical protein